MRSSLILGILSFFLLMQESFAGGVQSDLKRELMQRKWVFTCEESMVWDWVVSTGADDLLYFPELRVASQFDKSDRNQMEPTGKFSTEVEFVEKKKPRWQFPNLGKDFATYFRAQEISVRRKAQDHYYTEKAMVDFNIDKILGSLIVSFGGQYHIEFTRIEDNQFVGTLYLGNRGKLGRRGTQVATCDLTTL